MAFKNGGAADGVCIEYQADKVSNEFLVDLLANGGQNGHCPAANYPKSCTYVGDNKSQVLMLFYATKSWEDAKLMCGTNKGIFTSESGSIDYRNLPFAKAIFRTDTNECQEYNVEKMDSVTLNIFLASYYNYGNCPADPLTVGVCNDINYPKAGMAHKHYYLGAFNLTQARYLSQDCFHSYGGAWTPLP